MGKTLREYSRLIFLIREYQKREMGFDEAINKAVDECIKEGLADFERAMQENGYKIPALA